MSVNVTLAAGWRRRLTWMVLAAVLAALWTPDAWAYRGKKKKPGEEGKEPAAAGEENQDYKAKEMLDKGLEFLGANQEERGVNLLSSIPRMFPKSDVRFDAYLELGKYYVQKRNYELAAKQFVALDAVDDDELRAEAQYQTGICYYNLNSFDKAFVILRNVINEFPWSVYANEAYYYVGLCHFKLGRWAKAVEALEMVGASVPAGELGSPVGEGGQRVYVKVSDQDLVVRKETGEPLMVEVAAASGDRESLRLDPLGQSGEYYIGSLPTAPGAPAAGDGVLQTVGGEALQVTFNDENTEAGSRNQKLLTSLKMVSTATGGFTDGAFREYTRGVFGGNDAFVRIKDLDRDTSAQPDTVSARLRIEYKVEKPRDESLQGVDLSAEPETETRVRDTVTLVLKETGGHTGLFTGGVKTKVGDADVAPDQGDAVLTCAQGDAAVLEYTDDAHIDGDTPRTLRGEARMLIGTIQDVKIEHREVQSADIKARKDLIEAKIFLKLASIFKDVGLDQEAYEKADEGLERAEGVIRSSLNTSLERTLVEEAFSIKWDLLLVKDRLSEAIQVCHTLTRLFPDSTLVDKALLKIGLAKMNSDDWQEVDQAVGIFTSIFPIPKSTLKAEAAFRIAEVYERRAILSAGQDRKPDLSRAMLAFKQCAETYPDSPFAGESLDKIINFYINNADYRRAVELMERVFQDYPDASFLDMILFKWGIAAYRMNDLASAKQKFDQVLAEYPNSGVAEKAKKTLEMIEKKAQQ